MALALLLATLPATPFAEELPFPPTFRRDRVDDRDFEFPETFFLDVASFRLQDDWRLRWEEAGNAYQGTGGSTSSDDLYLFQEASLRKSLDERWDFSYRFLQDLDFDGQVLKNLVSLEHKEGPFAFGPVSHLDAFKENLDLGATASWRPSKAHAVQTWGFWVDPVFNQKTSTGDRYDKKAVTWAAAGRHLPRNDLRLGWGAGYIPPVALELASRGFTGHFTQLSYRGDCRWTLAGERTLIGELAGEETEKSRDYATASPSTVSVARSVQQARVGYRRPWGAMHLRFALEGVNFREWSRYPNAGSSTHRLRRREAIASAGVDRAVTERWTLRPTLLVDKLQNREDHPLSPGAERGNTGWESKLALGAEYRFKNSAWLVLNPTVMLEGFAFGGGNLQVSVEF
jgi:hypothetical protein